MNARIIPPASPSIRELANAAGALQDVMARINPHSDAHYAAAWLEHRALQEVSRLQREAVERSESRSA
jgi:hypothetical protein